MSKTRHFLSTALLVGPLWLCSCGGFKSLADVQKEYAIEKMPEAEDYPDDDAVVVVQSKFTQMEFEGNYDLVTTEKIHVIKRLFKNLEDHAEVEIPIYLGEKLQDISARTIKADGSVVPLKKNDFYKISGQSDGSTFYTDQKSVKFVFPAVEKGCYIEYEYTMFNDLPFVMGIWRIQRSVPVLRTSFALNIPIILLQNDWRWRGKAYNYDLGQPVITVPVTKDIRINQKALHKWTLQNIPAFRSEPYMPPIMNHIAYFRLAPDTWKTWNDIARWYYGRYFRPRLEVTEDVRKVAGELAPSENSGLQKLQAVHQYVAGMRYVAVELGIGGIQPNTPSTVLERQYGDCKDKSTLLIALLKAMNIKAEPVLVRTADEGTLDSQFPHWGFNHMIVKSTTGDGRVYWIDPTATNYELGALPSACEGIDVLVLHDDTTASIEKTSSSKPEENLLSVDISLNVTDSLALTGEVRLQYEGKEKFRKRHVFQDKTAAQCEQFCRDLMIDEFVNVRIDSVSLDSGGMDRPLVLTFRFTSLDAIRRQGDLYFVKSDPFKLFSDMGWLSKEDRKYPLRFSYPYTVRKNISIAWQKKSMSVRNIPVRLSLSNDYFKYVHQFDRQEDGVIKSSEEFRVTSTSIPAYEYKATKAFFDKVKKNMEEQIILTMEK